MAPSSKPSEALTAYRRALIDNDVETRVEELSTAVSTWEAHRADRDTVTERLAARERDDEDAVADAFEAAKNAGAKPATLAKIGLRPDGALAAARARRARAQTPPTSSDKDTAPAPTPVPSASDTADSTAGESAESSERVSA